jgi:RNA polymerase subunit RPABC4/transcription elongation factor Spt4
VGGETTSGEKPARLKPCRYCKTPIEKGLRRCPVCGTLTPHSDAKTTMIWIAIILVVMYLYTLVRGGQ